MPDARIPADPLAQSDLPPDQMGLLEGLTTTRTIRRYTTDSVPAEILRALLFAATRAPSGSNRQPFRFMVLTDGPKAAAAKRTIGEGARRIWKAKRDIDGYDRGSGVDSASPKARMARTMQYYVDHFEDVPVLILPCLVRYREPSPIDGASIYPACQNLLLAASSRLRWRLHGNAVPGRIRTARAARHPCRGEPGRNDHDRPARRTPRTGPAQATGRARLLGGLGSNAGLGAGPQGDDIHLGGSTEDPRGRP